MAHAYTPGLRVAEKTIVLRERRLPLSGEVLVKKGDEVKAEDIVARTNLPGNVQIVKAASILGISPEDIPEVMVKKKGEPVAKGEVIAMTSSFFGMFKSTVPSPVDGVLEEISNISGQIILREPPIPVEVAAYIDGWVCEVIPNEGVAIETTGAFVQGIFGIGGEMNGELKVAVQNAGDELTADMITTEHAGKVLVAGAYITYDTVTKAIDSGVKGIIVGGFRDSDLRRILGYDLGVAITGQEKIGLSLILTEGFGRMRMAAATFDLFKKFEGMKVSINGATQIRAGVMRPEIIVPLGEKYSQDLAGQDHVASGGLDVGSVIRVIREPHFGEIAEVTELPHELTPVESETKVRVLRAKFDDGTEMLMPRANVEMIET